MDDWNRYRSFQPDDADFEPDEVGPTANRRREEEAKRKQKLDDALDVALEGSFPASDPASVTQPAASPRGGRKR